EAVEQAFEKAKPQILNSDQGSQYTSPAYIQLVESAGVRISMDGRGRALDNVFTEQLWRSLKYEEVYLSDYVTPRQTRESISGYLEYYNERRPHQALNYQTPATVYASRGIELQQSCWNNQLEGGGCNLRSLDLVSRRWGAPQPDDPSRTKARPDLEPRALILLARFVEQRGHQSLPGPLPHLRHLAWRPD